MIDVEDISKLVGKRVVNQYGEFGTIDTINLHPVYPISVIFDSSFDEVSNVTQSCVT